ncbi:MAG: DNA repair protein RecO [Cyanobacteria bacterium J06598_3]
MKQRSYTATGINLKAMAMGETDRLVTVLTRERGLLRAIAPGARKHKSRLGGRSGLFVVNECLFTKGKSLDKLVQAETVQSFPGLSKNLAKLTASQYLAEIALSQALTDQPQEELYYLLIEHLTRLEKASSPNILPCLAQATFHLLALAGVAPEVFRCCLTRSPLDVELGNPDWKVGFSVSSGGAIALNEIQRLERDRLTQIERLEEDRLARLGQLPANTKTNTGPLSETAHSGIAQNLVKEANGKYNLPRPTFINPDRAYSRGPEIGLHANIAKEVARDLGLVGYLSAAELALMQQLSKPELVMSTSIQLPSATPRTATPRTATTRTAAASIHSSLNESRNTPADSTTYDEAYPGSKSGTIRQGKSQASKSGPHLMWRHIEKFLRHYAQYQLDRPIRSADLIDTCFNT